MARSLAYHHERTDMKKSILLATTLALAGTTATAQSSVTLFGVVDINWQRASQAGVAVSRLVGNGSQQSSRLGFRGVEDLGGGLSASFWLEGGLNADSGAGAPTNTNNQAGGAGPGGGGLTFDRRSTLSIARADLGELRLGRDYTPTFWNHTLFDPFGTVGAGGSRVVSQNTSFSNAGRTAVIVRASNSVGYFAPAQAAPFYAQAMVAFGENGGSGPTADDGRYAGLRLGYASGPLNAAVARGRVELAAGDVTMTNAGASWDFGAAKVFGQAFRDGSGTSTVHGSRGYLLGAAVPVGSGHIPASYTTSHERGGAHRKVSQVAVGYVHSLSKRTALYATHSRIRNANGASVNGNGGPAGVANAAWKALDLGLRHAF